MYTLFQIFNKIYKYFQFKQLKNQYLQTDPRLISDNKSTQTDYYYKSSSTNSFTQTDLTSLDINEDNEWNNLTWINSNTINMV